MNSIDNKNIRKPRENIENEHSASRKRHVERKPLYWKGYRNELLRLMCTCGAVSYNGLHMLNGEHRIYTRKLKEMEAEGIVNVARLKKKKAARLSNFEKNYQKYISFLPMGYYGHYIRYADTNAKNIVRYASDKQKAIRAYRESEVAMIMSGAGVNIYPEMKVALRMDNKIPSSGAYYYSASEIKECGQYKTIAVNENNGKTVINSRMIGCLICDGGHYIIYHSGDKPLRWRQSSEGQIAYCAAKVINMKCENAPIQGSVKESIVIAYSDSVYVKIMSDEKKNTLEIINANNGYENMYAITYTQQGKRLLSFMTRKNWKETLIRKYLPVVDTSHSVVACDYTDGEIKILLFCIPDLVKLKKFKIAAEWAGDKENYQVYCFDYQVPFIKEVAGDVVDIYETSFDEFCEEMKIQ